MESVKPVIDQETILLLLKEHFHRSVSELTPVEGGLIAQTLSFRVNEKEYILRLTTNAMEATYQKEGFLYGHFASPAIPIPPIHKAGRLGNVFYAISEKMPGRGLKFISMDEYNQTLPSIIETLYAIHQVDVQDWHGYGWLDDNGMGMFPSWKDFLTHIIEEERPDGFYGTWHTLFHTSFLDRDVFERVYKQMLRLLATCPEERYLVHGGYGYNNVLAQDGKVTAVLDWLDAMYGDFVYDFAVLNQWPPPGIDYPELLYQYYTSHGMSLPNFRERLTCYQLYNGLDGMRFFAKTKNEKAYRSTCQKLEKLLSAL